MRQMRDHNVNFRFVGLMGSCNRQQLESLCESIGIHKEFIYVGINIDQNEKDEAETQQKEEVVKTANETSPLPLFAVEWAEGMEWAEGIEKIRKKLNPLRKRTTHIARQDLGEDKKKRRLEKEKKEEEEETLRGSGGGTSDSGRSGSGRSGGGGKKRKS